MREADLIRTNPQRLKIAGLLGRERSFLQYKYASTSLSRTDTHVRLLPLNLMECAGPGAPVNRCAQQPDTRTRTPGQVRLDVFSVERGGSWNCVHAAPAPLVCRRCYWRSSYLEIQGLDNDPTRYNRLRYVTFFFHAGTVPM